MREPDVIYQDMLTDAGGLNPYGDPIFKFSWSEMETKRISNGIRYQDYLVCNEMCWLLMKWEPAEFWGTDAEWNYNNRESNGLMTAGEYPHNGQYRVLRKLMNPHVIGDEMGWVPMELNTSIVTDILPLIQGFLSLSYQQRAQLIEDREKEQKQQLAKKFIASRENYRGIATASQIQKKEEAIGRFLNDPKRIREALQASRKRAN